jgi:hypothetical protein
MVAGGVRFEEPSTIGRLPPTSVDGVSFQEVAVEPRTIWNGEHNERFLIPFRHRLS